MLPALRVDIFSMRIVEVELDFLPSMASYDFLKLENTSKFLINLAKNWRVDSFWGPN